PGGELAALLELAARIRRNGPDARAIAGKKVGLVFFNPSLRTRVSMELAAMTQGAHAVALTPGGDAWKLEMRHGAVMDGDTQEHVVEAVRVLAEMVDLIAVRTFAGLKSFDDDFAEPVLAEFARESKVPVVNMESAMDHPLQGLADLLTLQEEFGPDLTGVPVTLTWAPHPRPLPMAVPSAFLRACARMGMEIRVAAPAEFGPPAGLLDDVRAKLAPGGSLAVFREQSAAFRGTRAVYAKAWAAPCFYADATAGLEARRRHGHWTVRESTMALGNDAIFMHCLPVRRNVVVADEVLDGPRCRVYREAGNRLITAQAVLKTLLGGAR
ncbi:MAG: N-acetylornithine carbamoyltransferase, partial [Planctomycetes bacterium]|nr:N-acetylornithine carbamoyltransferase [Planctomycetota bacterium]